MRPIAGMSDSGCERSSAFLAANSSDDRMPLLCNSASSSILVKRSASWALSGRYGSLAGATRGSGALVCTPSTETIGRVETPTVPCWLVRVSGLAENQNRPAR
jgi:hypothetical protein